MNDPKLWYPRKSKPLSERYEKTSFSDQVAGTLNPIVYALNKGKNILPNSEFHRTLKELLMKANGE